MAWVGYAGHDPKMKVPVVAHSGLETSYLDAAKLTWADQERGRGPAGTAIRTGFPALCRDITSDPLFAPWREQALQQGYRSCLALPLHNDDEVLGAISIYATDTGAFDDTEQRLLEELSTSLSFGIVALRALAERRRGEETRDRLAAVVESSDDAIISKSLDGKVTAWNSGAEKVFGYTAAESLGKSLDRLLPPEHPNEESEILTRVTRGERINHFETTRLRKDGQRIHISATISPVKDRSGAIVGVAKIARDITERKQTDEARERLAAAVECSDDAIISKTMDGMISSWNPGAEKLFGYTAAEVMGKPLLLLLPPDRAAEENDTLECLRQGRSVTNLETVRVRKDGLHIDVSVTISPIRDRAGSIVGASKIARDITERKRVLEALRQSEERFQAIANGIPQLAWMAEADGSVFWFNQRWYDYTGTTLEQSRDWSWRNVHDPNFLPQVLERWQGAIDAGIPFEMEFPLRGGDGHFRVFLTQVMPVKDAEGSVTRWFGTNTDITEWKEAEKRLALQAEELARSRVALESQTLLLQSVLDSISEGLVVADHRENLVIWNPAAAKIIGMGATTLPSSGWPAHYGLFLSDAVIRKFLPEFGSRPAPAH
jgi:PAS domain S-box-containing protein